MPNRPTRRTTLLLGLTLAAAPATALAATRYAPHADAATVVSPRPGSTIPRRRRSRCSSSPARRTPRWTGRRSTSTSRTSATAAATPPASSASAPAPATCSSWSSSTPTASRATCWPSTCPPCARSNGSDSHAGPRPELHQGLEDRRQGHGVPAGAERRARPRLLQPGGARRARPTACGALGQFIYYDAIVMHGHGGDATSFGGIRKTRPERRPSRRRRAATRRPTSTPSSTPGSGR